MIRVLIADDEPVALQRLELAVAGVPEAEVVARAKNGRQALELIKELEPDVAVLDIEMPGLDGLAVVESLENGNKVPEVVFVTAYQDYAVRAFDIHAVDYVLKPIEFDRFSDAMGLVMARLKGRTAESRLKELQAVIAELRAKMSGAPQPYDQEVWVRGRTGLQRVAVNDIELIAADGDYVQLHAEGRTYLHKDTIASLESRLDPNLFMRVHRSAIVKLQQVSAINRKGSRKVYLSLRSGTPVPVGPRFAEAVLEALRAKRWR